MPDNPKVVPVVAPVAAANDKKYKASLYGSETPLPDEFVALIQALEQALELQIWMLIQNDDGDHGDIGPFVYQEFYKAKDKIERNKPVGMLLHSPGGQAEEAYKIVRLFQRRTDKFKTIVPCYAKSAATIMALGGQTIVMGLDAEIGPLDVQILNPDQGEYDSALNAVQSLERLNAYALTALDQFMLLLVQRLRKKPDAILSLASEYATNMIRPLVEKIDSINLTKKSRELKVAEDYAVRLMKEAGYQFNTAKQIAGALVERYSTHGFVIDRTESKSNPTLGVGLGIKVTEPSAAVELVFNKLQPYLEKLTVIGTLQEV